MSNAEWMASLPGTDDQKAFLLNCVSCHTLERIVRSTHDANEWTQVITRMMGYGAVSQPIKPQRMLDPARSGTPEQYRKTAEYLATINQSAVTGGSIRSRPWLVPTGRSTRAIITEYDLPRRDDRAARRARGCPGSGLVLGFRRALHLQVRPEDAQAHRVSR